MTDSALTLAAAPVQFWWVAPTLTLLALGLALWTSLSSLALQTRMLEDNRRLRIVDDVREVLAETLRDLHNLTRAFDEAQEVVTFNERLERLLRRLQAPNLPAPAVQIANQEIEDVYGEINDRKRACVDAVSGLELQAERIRLLLGGEHPLYFDGILSILIGTPSIKTLNIWDLPAGEGEELKAARLTARRQLVKAHDRTVAAIDEFSAAGRDYLDKQTRSRPSQTFRALWTRSS